MSFNFQGPSEIPMIQNAQNMMNNGGGGNLGYFQGRRKKKEEVNPNVFATDDEDSFILSSDVQTDAETEEKKPKGMFRKLLDNLMGEKKEN